VTTRRETLIAIAGCALVASPFPARAQAKKAPALVGWLGDPESNSYLAVFKEGLAALGWKEGSNYVLEVYADGKTFEQTAKDPSARQPVVLVTTAGWIGAAAKAAPNIPIVQCWGASPVAMGNAASLARPGGMVTGVTNIASDLSAKYLELLLAAAPNVKRVGLLVDLMSHTHAMNMEHAQRALEHHRVEARLAEASKVEEVELALSHLAKERVEGLVVLPTRNIFIRERQRIAKFALSERWPAIAGPSDFAEEGVLLTYSANRPALYRRVASYVDRILKGGRPGDLPIEQPTQFQLVINMSTAKALGIKIPRWLLLQADRVIG
jgi:putative ABC transport system substrate-binding protein